MGGVLEFSKIQGASLMMYKKNVQKSGLNEKVNAAK